MILKIIIFVVAVILVAFILGQILYKHTTQKTKPKRKCWRCQGLGYVEVVGHYLGAENINCTECNPKSFKETKVFVLGSNGMLGRYVYTYFKSKGCFTTQITRTIIDAAKTSELDIRHKLFKLGVGERDVVINCIGLIKQRKDATALDFLHVNSTFPLMLANVCKKIGAHLIHPSTDCVFDGLDGPYNEEFKHNADDVYGRTKSLGEPENATVIRTSIIGEELKNQLSFVEWVKSEKGNEVNGFTNHKWNGVTCLEFAKICEQIIKRNLYWRGVVHLMSPEPITKYQMVEYVSNIYGLGITIKAMETPNKCDRSLSSIQNVEIDIKSLKTQIQEMKDYYPILTNTNK